MCVRERKRERERERERKRERENGGKRVKRLIFAGTIMTSARVKVQGILHR